MLRVETETGWWLITHPDHAQLAAEFAAHWGNDLFVPPSPRENVLHGVRVHDDGWMARDAHPAITRAGKPSAFSEELVGKYSAFEEIDLAEYLAVREGALDKVEKHCAYAALLVSMHTYNLLTERADRSTIVPDQLPLLDDFLARQRVRQEALRLRLRAAGKFAETETTETAVVNNFRLLQAMDNLSLYSCVGYTKPGTLLHALPTKDGGAQAVNVIPVTSRHFRLEPYPFDEPTLTFPLPARHVEGKVFASAAVLGERFSNAPVEKLTITISAV
jgi:hypothetical protein